MGRMAVVCVPELAGTHHLRALATGLAHTSHGSLLPPRTPLPLRPRAPASPYGPHCPLPLLPPRPSLGPLAPYCPLGPPQGRLSCPQQASCTVCAAADLLAYLWEVGGGRWGCCREVMGQAGSDQ